ncbi:hypothetical protein E2C01_009403 [Portunus trituberculatus]|uniref:Uncharacterized protein n=1 Tax=Portunus trituberculatus TaxID=210409 RepID=A0A5B7D5I1_PORTR|nr:hypothetical protein [Portunus trituberculatus]
MKDSTSIREIHLGQDICKTSATTIHNSNSEVCGHTLVTEADRHTGCMETNTGTPHTDSLTKPYSAMGSEDELP